MLSWCWFLRDLEELPPKLGLRSCREVLYVWGFYQGTLWSGREHLRKAGVGCLGYKSMAVHVWFSDFCGGCTVNQVFIPLAGLDEARSGIVVTNPHHQSKASLLGIHSRNSRQVGQVPCPPLLSFLLPLASTLLDKISGSQIAMKK